MPRQKLPESAAFWNGWLSETARPSSVKPGVRGGALWHGTCGSPAPGCPALMVVVSRALPGSKTDRQFLTLQEAQRPPG